MGGLLSPITDALFGAPPSPPPPPDYKGAAEATSAGNLEAQRRATLANRPDEYTPYGSRVWTQLEDSPDQWRTDISFTPEGQRIFDLQQQTQEEMGRLGLMGLGKAGEIFSDPFSISGQTPTYQGPGAYGENRQRTVDAMMSRVNEDVEQDRDKMRSTLISRGIPPGSEAWNREMKQIDRQLTDARQQAEIAATQQAGMEYQSSLAGAGQEFGAGMDTRRQGITEALLQRQTPLNEINAWQSGSQVQAPQFQAFGQQGATAGPDYLGATGMQSQYDLGTYNADVAGRNALTSGLFSLGAGGLAGGYFGKGKGK